MSKQRLFMSHASEDAVITGRIVAYFEEHGVPCWISSRDIPPGQIYAEAITEGIRDARAVVVICSEAANRSSGVKREVELGSRHDKSLHPIRIDASEPAAGLDYYLNNTQWVDFKRDGDRALDRIVAFLQDPAAPRTDLRPPAPRQSALKLPLSIVGASLLVGLGVWFAWSHFMKPSADAPAPDIDLGTAERLVGSYHWDGVACGEGPTVTLEGGILIFTMPGTETYRHEVESVEARVVRTRVLEPETHRGETYELRSTVDELEVKTGEQTDVWQRCPDNP